jgi:thioredoxin-like negative regulator of GroEL
MNDSRLQQVEQMLADDPQDTFLRYAYALELQKADRSDECLDRLTDLMADQPPHVPSFFMAAQQLVVAGETGQARELLEQGIQHAQQQGNLHAAAEMGELLASLPSEEI